MMEMLAQTTQPVITGMDVVNEVMDFVWYGWLILVGTGVIVGFVVGFLIPLWIAKTQERKFTDRQEQLEQMIKSLRDQAVGQINHHSAMHWYEMARQHFMEYGGPWVLGIRYWCFAIDSALEAHWLPTDVRWQWMLNCLGGFPEANPGTTADIAALPENKDVMLSTVGKLVAMGNGEPYCLLRRKLEHLIEAAASKKAQEGETG